MSTITKNTQHGTGGHWHTDFEAPISARNLLRAYRAESSAQNGVGGYLVNIQIGDVVIDQNFLSEATLEDAQKICDDPESYSPRYWD